MHAEAWNFLHAVLTEDITRGVRVLEIGSYNVNGTARMFCDHAAEYVGIDRRNGPGVDHVDAKDAYDGKAGFDIVISTETLEHASDPAAVIATAKRAIKPGGLLVITAAGPGRKPHSADGGPYEPESEPYQGIKKTDLESWLSDWERVNVQYARSHDHPNGDIYATAYAPAEWPDAKTAKSAKPNKDEPKPAKADSDKGEGAK